MPDWLLDYIRSVSSGFQDWSTDVSNGWNNFVDGAGQWFSDLAENFGEHQLNNVYGLTGVGHDPSQPAPDTQINNDGIIGSSIEDALDGGPSLSSYVQENPNLSAEDYLKYMASHSDEWSEKWLDYMLEKQSIDEQNKYTASREDTAYQRLVSDLKSAGLNPAMMFGSSASPQAGGSVGVVKASEGANARTIGNYEKMKKLIISFMLYRLKGLDMSANMTTNFMGSILKMLI